MKKLTIPSKSMEETLNLCKSGISQNSYKNRLTRAMDEFTKLSDIYKKDAKCGTLFNISALPKGIDENTNIIADITKKELVNLYEYYLRNSKKPGRSIYDELYLSANDQCPFCGGIGRPRNLDHFLPKAFFPQFSILPVNLVPSCRDCNMDGKGQDYAKTENEQIIHPYLDKNRFFSKKWVSAKVIQDNPCTIEYYVSPPSNWNINDQERVRTHFHDFDLAKRYSIQAADELSTIISQRKGYMKNLSEDEYSNYLASNIDSPLFINHWKKVLYYCLSNDEWFCSQKF